MLWHMIKRTITCLLLVVALLRPVPLMAQDTGPVPDSDSFCDRNPAVCTVAEEIECTPVWMLYSGVFAGFIGLIAQAPDIIAKADETPKWAPASTSFESWEAWPCAEPVQTVNFTMSGGNALGDGSLLTGFGGFEFGFSGRYLTGGSSFLIAGSRRISPDLGRSLLGGRCGLVPWNSVTPAHFRYNRPLARVPVWRHPWWHAFLQIRWANRSPRVERWS